MEKIVLKILITDIIYVYLICKSRKQTTGSKYFEMEFNMYNKVLQRAGVRVRKIANIK